MAREAPDAAEPPQRTRERREIACAVETIPETEILRHVAKAAVVGARLAGGVARERTRRVPCAVGPLEQPREAPRHRRALDGSCDLVVAPGPPAIERRGIVATGLHAKRSPRGVDQREQAFAIGCERARGSH